MAGSIWAMKAGDTYASEFGTIAAAVAYVEPNGHVQLGPGNTDAIPAHSGGVTVQRMGAGVAERDSIEAFKGGPWYDVRAFGAKGDDSTDDTASIQAAITAAEAAGAGASVYFPKGTYKSTGGGLACKRETWLVGIGQPIVKLYSTTATLVKWATSTLVRQQGGGARGIAFIGAAGSSTSIGISFGDPSQVAYYAHRLSLIDCEVTGFGHGVVIDGPGAIAGDGKNSATDGFLLRRCSVYDNVYNGMLVKTTFPIEISTISECHFFRNGYTQPTGTGIQLSASGGGGGLYSAALRLVVLASTFNVNGDGTLGMIHCPSSGSLDLHWDSSTTESQGAGRSAVVALSDGVTSGYNYPKSRVHVTNSSFGQYTPSSYKEQIILAAGELHVNNSRFVQQVPADFTVSACSNTSTSPLFTTSGNFITSGVRPGMPLSGTGVPANAYVKSVDSTTQLTMSANGTGASSVTLSFDALLAQVRLGVAGAAFASATMVGNYFEQIGTSANARIVNLALGHASNTSIFSVGNVAATYISAASLVMNPLSCANTGDLHSGAGGDYRALRAFAVETLELISPSDRLMALGFSIAKMNQYGCTAYFYSESSLAGMLQPVVATGSLPAAGAANDGKILIEDNGAGDRNLVIYGGGQRFRIDGGAAF